MSQPVKLSDGLVMEARAAGESMERSIAGQVEFWARLGKALEPVLTGQQMRVLGRPASVEAVVERLDSVDSPEGRQRVKDYLASEPYPHYFAHPEKKGLLIREDEGGQRTVGRFIDREFVVAEELPGTSAAA